MMQINSSSMKMVTSSSVCCLRNDDYIKRLVNNSKCENNMMVFVTKWEMF